MIDSITLIAYVLIQEFFNFSIKFDRHSKYEYHLVYKGVTFNYYMGSQTLVIRTNAHKILQKGCITVQDLENYKEIVSSIVFEITGIKNLSLQLSRLDYCVDLILDYENGQIEDTVELLHKHVESYRHMKIDNIYDSSIYLKTKRGNYNLNCYDKYAECQLDEYKGIFRLELQIKKAKIKRELKRNGITRELDNYWSKESMEMYFFDFLRGFFYTGNYYRLDVALEKVESSSYTKVMKHRLCLFLKRVNEKGMTETKKWYSSQTAKNYIELLEKIGVNPVTISNDKDYKEMRNLLDKAKEEAEKMYFNSSK